MPSRDESKYMAAVADMGCILCRLLRYGKTPAEVHHPRTGTGMGKRGLNMEAIPLCLEHHRGNTGLHGMGRKAFERHYGITERELVEKTKAEIERKKGLEL